VGYQRKIADFETFRGYFLNFRKSIYNWLVRERRLYCDIETSSILISEICSAESEVAAYGPQYNPAKQQTNIKWWPGRLLYTEEFSAAVTTSIFH
jgi:lysozyme family protein